MNKKKKLKQKQKIILKSILIVFLVVNIMGIFVFLKQNKKTNATANIEIKGTVTAGEDITNTNYVTATGVTVEIFNQAGDRQEKFTGSNGEYSFPNMSPGEYTIKYTYNTEYECTSINWNKIEYSMNNTDLKLVFVIPNNTIIEEIIDKIKIKNPNLILQDGEIRYQDNGNPDLIKTAMQKYGSMTSLSPNNLIIFVATTEEAIRDMPGSVNNGGSETYKFGIFYPNSINENKVKEYMKNITYDERVAYSDSLDLISKIMTRINMTRSVDTKELAFSTTNIQAETEKITVTGLNSQEIIDVKLDKLATAIPDPNVPSTPSSNLPILNGADDFISGYVFDKDTDTKIKEVKVELLNEDGTPTGVAEHVGQTENGQYKIPRPSEGKYKLRFTYGIIDSTDTPLKEYNGQNYEVAQKNDIERDTNNNKNNVYENSDRRRDVNDLFKNINNEITYILNATDSDAYDKLKQNAYMEAFSEEFAVKDYDASDPDAEESKKVCINMGIQRRPEIELKLEKYISGIRYKLADGQNFKEIKAGDTAELDVINRDRFYLIQINEELMHGSNIEIEYTIKINDNRSNTGDYETTATKVIDYVDYRNSSIIYDPEAKLINGGINKDQGWKIMKLQGNELRSEDGSLTLTDDYIEIIGALDEDKQYLVNDSGNNEMRLVVSKVITDTMGSDKLRYENSAEVLEYTNNAGRRTHSKNTWDNYFIPGDLDPRNSYNTDEDKSDEVAPEVTIIPPLGDVTGIIESTTDNKNNMPVIIVAYIVIMNLAGFWLMFLDKKKAKKQRQRISENTFLYTALLGGSIGCLCGMYKFRHKTKKPRFTIGFPAILIVQIILVIYLIIK